MDANLLHECLQMAFEDKISFSETVEKMASTGVERYFADLTRLRKIHYGIDGDTHEEQLPLTNPNAIPNHFSEDGVKESLAAIQQRRIDYPEFLRRIMAAGVADYTVFINGRKAIYFGRNGDFYIEPFPESSPKP